MAKARRAKKVEVRRKREFTLHGRTLPELQGMSLEQLSKVLTARARRSIRRGFTDEQRRFLEKIREFPREKALRTHVRDALVLPDHVGHRLIGTRRRGRCRGVRAGCLDLLQISAGSP